MQTAGEAVSLISTFREQIHQEVKSLQDRDGLDLLLDNLSVYAKRVNRVPLSDAEQRLPSHPEFAGLSAVPQKRAFDSMLRRLRMLLRFRISSYEKVTRDLLTGLFPKDVDPLSGRDVRLLTLIYQNPEMSPTAIAKQIGVSVPTVRKLTWDLHEKVALRFAAMVDWRRFKLRHYGIFFITRDVESSRKMEQVLQNEMSAYMTSAVFDTTYQRGFAGFRIPDQHKPLQLFKRQLDAIEDAFLDVIQIHEVRASYVAICFDHFDYETGDWLIEGDMTTLGLLNFVRENWEVLPRPRGVVFTESKPFDQLDYYIAAFLTGDGRARMKKLLNRLAMVGHDAPRTTVSTRKSKLYKEGSLLPTITFNSPLLPFFVSFAIKCNPGSAEAIVLGIAQMPTAFASLTDIGCVVNVKVPIRSLGPILNLIAMVRDEPGVEEIWQMQQYKNVGSRSSARIGHKWNGSYWEWSEEEFTLPSLGLE